MDKDNYMKETCIQHHDGRFYPKINNDRTPTLTNKLKLLINELQPNLQNDVLKLIPSHLRPATFYTIPKVHKLPNLVVSTCSSFNPDNFIIEAKRLNINPPGRPIVSGIGTLTEYVSAFVDRELQPLLLLLLWSHRRRLKMILSSAWEAHELIKGPPQAEALTLSDEGRASEP